MPRRGSGFAIWRRSRSTGWRWACTATDRLVVLRTKENPSAAWLGEIRLTESSVAALLKQINDGVQSALKARDKEAAATGCTVPVVSRVAVTGAATAAAVR